MPSTTKGSGRRHPVKLISLFYKECKDLIAEDASLNALRFTPTDIERSVRFCFTFRQLLLCCRHTTVEQGRLEEGTSIAR